MTNSVFELDSANPDIAKLTSESETRERTGFVHIGHFSVRLELTAAGALVVHAFPHQNEYEDQSLGVMSFSKARAVDAGGVNSDQEGEG